MKAELVQARRDVAHLHHQFGYLARRGKIDSVKKAEEAASDINLFFLSSLMDIRADVLRLFLALQDDPEYAGQRQAALRAKFEETNRRLRALLEEDPIQGFHRDLRRRKADQWLLRRWLTRGLADRIRKVEAILEDFRPIRERIESWTGASDSANDAACEQSIVVYRDLGGEGALRAYHTQDLRLQRKGA